MFFRLILGRVGFSTILFIGTAILNAKTVVIYFASPLLFDSLEEGGVNRVNGGRGTDLLLDNESSVILSNRLLGNVPRKFSFVQSI